MCQTPSLIILPLCLPLVAGKTIYYSLNDYLILPINSNRYSNYLSYICPRDLFVILFEEVTEEVSGPGLSCTQIVVASGL